MTICELSTLSDSFQNWGSRTNNLSRLTAPKRPEPLLEENEAEEQLVVVVSSQPMILEEGPDAVRS